MAKDEETPDIRDLEELGRELTAESPRLWGLLCWAIASSPQLAKLYREEYRPIGAELRQLARKRHGRAVLTSGRRAKATLRAAEKLPKREPGEMPPLMVARDHLADAAGKIEEQLANPDIDSVLRGMIRYDAEKLRELSERAGWLHSKQTDLKRSGTLDRHEPKREGKTDGDGRTRKARR